jgi:membrane protein implicated in regulation of membrane protease activity
MRRTVWTYPRADGGTDIVTQGPIGRGLIVVRLAMLVFVGIAVLVALFTGQWSAAGVLFLLFALLTPNYRKMAKRRARAQANKARGAP